MKGPKIIVLGPQGSGKGTQSGRLSRHFHIPHISAGEELRQEMAQGTALGKKITHIMNAGVLIDDRDTNAVMRKRLSTPDARYGWISDGYPRRMGQLKPFLRHTKPDIILLLELTNDMAVRRLSGRRVCPHGHVYHLQHDRPRKRPGYCDHDGLKLKTRDDDTPSAIRKRLSIYRHETVPMLRWAHGRIPIITVDAHPSIPMVYRTILRKLKPYEWPTSPRTKTSRR